MSRGLGRVERAIDGLLSKHPYDAFTTDEIARACFPGLQIIEKKHRVSALRALRKVNSTAGWLSEMISGRRGELVIYNPLNLSSYAIGRTRAHEGGDWSGTDSRSGIISTEKAVAMLMGRDEPTHWRSARDRSYWVRTGGPYPVAVARNVAIKEGDAHRAAELWEEFSRLVRAAVYLPESISGDIHPDFLNGVVEVAHR